MGDAATYRLPIVVLVAALVFWGYCLLDVTRADEYAMRTFSRPIWLVIVLFGSVLGGVLWLSVGRPQRPGRR